MPVLPKKVCNVSYHAPKEGKMGLQEGKNGRVIAKSTGKVQRRHRKGLALGSHWACAGLADVFAAALHKRRAGQRAKEKQGKARPKRQGTARHGKARNVHTHTYAYIHTHTLYNSVLQPYALGRYPMALALEFHWQNFFCLLCIFVLTYRKQCPIMGLSNDGRGRHLTAERLGFPHI